MHKESSQTSVERNSAKYNLYIYCDEGEGRLGNRLFQYASALGIARYSNRKILFSPRLLRLKYLLPNLTLETTNGTCWQNWRRMKESHNSIFDKRFFQLPNKNVTIGKYLQSYLYSKDITNEIFKTFSGINLALIKLVETNFISNAQKDIRTKLLYTNHTTVCVHVRRGDLLEGGGYKGPEPEELLYAMNWMEKRHNQVVFYVASNGMDWCQKHLKRKNSFFSYASFAEEDFVLMQSCDHMIMTFGTFGWWAAWMTSQRGGDVMAYRTPYEPDTYWSRNFDRASNFPGHWWSYQNQSVILFKDVINNTQNEH